MARLPSLDGAGSGRPTPASGSGLRAIAVVLAATALPILSLMWAAGVARTEVERRASAGLTATAKATVLQEQQAWDDAVRVVVSAASRPVPLSALELRDTGLATQGVQNILITGPFAAVRLYSPFGDVVATAALPGVTPTPVTSIAPGPPTFGDPTSVGTGTARQVSVPAGTAGAGRLVVDVDLSHLLGKPADLGFGRTGAKFLVTPQGMVVAGSAAVGTRLLSPVNLRIAAEGQPVTTVLFSPFYKRLSVESYEPIPNQNLGILVQQSRSEVMAGADRLSALLRWVAMGVAVLGTMVAAFVGVILGRRSRRLIASERRLAESETASRLAADQVQFLSVVTAAMSEGVVVVRAADSTIAYANTSYESMFGYQPGELVGRCLEDLVPPVTSESPVADMRRRLLLGGTWRGEIRSVHKDGSEFWCALNATSFDHPAFGPVWIAVNTDISARRLAEDAQTRLAKIVHASRDAILAKTVDGVVTSWNRGAEILFGYTAEEMVGVSVDVLVPADRIAEERDLRARVATGTGIEQKETVRLRKDGSSVDVSVTMSPIEDAGGVITGIATICRDVTERKRAEAALLEREEELALARDQALEASRLKSDFLANMSHEIRTPMNAVIGLTGLLLDSALSTEQREYAEAVRSAGEALLEIINDLLDFSKIEAGKLRLELMDFELSTVMEEVADLFRSEAHDKHLGLKTFVHPDVPAFVRGDPGRLRQVLTNLVGNAIKFSELGDVVVRVDAVSRTGDVARVRFQVADTGIGISAQGQRQLFQAFEQVDSSPSRRHGGTGLGLAICKQLVEMMGGAIGLDSALGAGSTFWFSVPLAVVAAPAETSVPPQYPSASVVHPGVRLLVAEDNPVNQLVAVRMLEKLGYKADVAANGSEAVDALMRIDYAAVLMDCQMPEMDGFDATREIRRRQPAGHRTPVIAMTAAAAQEDRDRCFRADMDDYVSKPVRARELAAVLSRWVPDDSSAA
jgi:PAS domain S-box-containing protein